MNILAAREPNSVDASVLQIAASVGDLDLETNLDRSVFFSASVGRFFVHCL
jgi:hypothetical protein